VFECDVIDNKHVLRKHRDVSQDNAETYSDVGCELSLAFCATDMVLAPTTVLQTLSAVVPDLLLLRVGMDQWTVFLLS